uniref:Uncharacterized protein n=1 Tax=Anguilla anguilla TaxID=7936 RepID=A0A0E9RBQ5_ANGAN
MPENVRGCTVQTSF